MSSGGQALGGIVGAVAGFFIGGPSGALYGAQVGMMVGGYLDPPKGPNIQGPRLNDMSVQTSTYGAVIPRLYGTAAVHGNILWVEGNKLKEHVHTTKNKSGGKGGGGKSAGTTTTYTYSATFAVGLCRGPIVGIRRLWLANRLIYDAGSNDPSVIQAGNAIASGWRLYTGSDTQTADPRIQADQGVANTSAWPGLAYLVIYDLDLTKYSNSLMGVQVKAEICTGTAQSTMVQTTAAIGWQSDRSDFGACVFNGRIVLLGGASGASHSPSTYYSGAWSSGDGITFDNYADFEARFGFGCAVFDDRIWCVAGGRYNPADSTNYIGNDVIWTADGINWYGTVAPVVDPNVPFDKRIMPAVCVHDGYLYAVGGMQPGVGGPAPRADVYRMATDGTWETIATTTAWATVGGGTGRHGASLCSMGGYLYLVGGIGNPSAYGSLFSDCWRSADDGATWTQMTADIGFGTTHHGEAQTVVWNNELWCIVPRANNSDTVFWTDAYHSSDGITWTLEPLTAFSPYRTGGAALVFNGTLYYLGGNGHPDASILAYRVITPSTVPLANIVTAECLNAALLSGGDLNTTALTDAVRGFTVGSAGSIRSALEILQGAFPFDVIQSGYSIKFVPRGGASVVSIAEGDLDTRAGGEKPKDKLPLSREMQTQLPRRVSISYPDVDREYDINEQSVERITAEAVNETRLDMAIVLNADEAAQIADVLLGLYWMERTEVGPFTLPPTFRTVEPGDVVTVSHAGQVYDIRLTRVEYGATGIVTCQGRFASSAIYSSTAVGSAGAATGGLPISLAGPTDCLLLDIPCLSSNHDTWGETAAVYGLSAGWQSGILYRSDDSGQTYSTVQGFLLGADVFRATTVLAAGRTDIPDTANTLTVKPVSQGADVFSCTYADLLAGANLAAFGAPGRWEIISFQTVTAGAGTTKILRDFGRGLFGTEWAMTAHAVGDMLVMLDYSVLSFVGVPAAAYLSSRLWRAVTAGAEFNDYVDTTETYGGVNLKPLSPVGVAGGLNTATNDFDIRWTRRTRIGGEWINGIDAPLSETSEAYDIEIWDAGFNTLKRTLHASTPSVVYTSAMATADFGAPQLTLGVIVYQISGKIGRGYPAAKRISTPFVDPFQANARLMLHFDGADNGTVFTDSFGAAASFIGSPVTVQTPGPAWGTASAKLGSNGAITLTPCPFTGIANGASYTIEFRFRSLTWVAGDHQMFCAICGTQFMIAAAAGGVGSGFMEFFFEQYGSGWSTLHAASAIPITDTGWHHFEVGCNGTNTYLFIDGTLIATKVGAVNIGSTGPFTIGDRSAGTPSGQWLLDEFNVIVGACRHTASFAPYTAPYNY